MQNFEIKGGGGAGGTCWASKHARSAGQVEQRERHQIYITLSLSRALSLSRVVSRALSLSLSLSLSLALALSTGFRCGRDGPVCVFQSADHEPSRFHQDTSQVQEWRS